MGVGVGVGVGGAVLLSMVVSGKEGTCVGTLRLPPMSCTFLVVLRFSPVIPPLVPPLVSPLVHSPVHSSVHSSVHPPVHPPVPPVLRGTGIGSCGHLI